MGWHRFWRPASPIGKLFDISRDLWIPRILVDALLNHFFGINLQLITILTKIIFKISINSAERVRNLKLE